MISETHNDHMLMNGTNREARETRMDGAPSWLLWTMTFINRIGFPIAVAIYLGYMQLNAMPKIVDALNTMSATMGKVQESIRDNSEILRRIKREGP